MGVVCAEVPFTGGARDVAPSGSPGAANGRFLISRRPTAISALALLFVRQNVGMTWTRRAIVRSWLASLLVLAACGSQPMAAPAATAAITSDAASTTAASTTLSPTTTAIISVAAPTTKPPPTSSGPATTNSVPTRHPGHDDLAAALPKASELSWLPASAQFSNDSDLTTRLDLPACGGQSSPVASRESDATNRAFDEAGQRVAEVTYYDVETSDDAHQFIAAISGYFSCPNPANTAVTSALISLDGVAGSKCDEAVAVRTRQPVSETIDAWCRVRNLVAWIRLYPTTPTTGTGVAVPDDTGLVPAPGENLTPPSDSNATATVAVVGEHLRALVGEAN